MAYVKQTWVDAPSTASPIVAARLNYMETGIEAASTSGGAVDSVDGQTGVVALSAVYSDILHKHPGSDLTSGFVDIARATPGSTITVDKVKNGGTWPARPTARTDITVIWKGNTDPGAAALDGDEWKVTA